MERGLWEAEERQAAALQRLRLQLLEDLEHSLSQRGQHAPREAWQPGSVQMALHGPVPGGDGLVEAVRPQAGWVPRLGSTGT